MIVYACSTFCQHKTHAESMVTTELRHNVCLVRATSYNEAYGLVMTDLQEKWPPAKGWERHCAVLKELAPMLDEFEITTHSGNTGSKS